MGVGRGAPRTTERIGALADEPRSLTSTGTRSAASCCETAGTYTRAQIRLPLRRKSRAERAEACLSCLRPLLLLLLLLLAAV